MQAEQTFGFAARATGGILLVSWAMVKTDARSKTVMKAVDKAIGARRVVMFAIRERLTDCSRSYGTAIWTHLPSEVLIACSTRGVMIL